MTLIRPESPSGPSEAAGVGARGLSTQRREGLTSARAPEALEAAHVLGRDWHAGHNQASDGLLLRRDLHTLYDRGLLRITDVGLVEFDARVASHYGQFAGALVARRVESID